MQNNEKLNIEEGTISFWIEKNRIQFSDNKNIPLIQLSPLNGILSIEKDNDNKLKFIHVYIGKGRTDVDYDVSDLDPNKSHMILVTWSVIKKEIIIYIDGEKLKSSKILY